jgi:hypothetical protein
MTGIIIFRAPMHKSPPDSGFIPDFTQSVMMPRRTVLLALNWIAPILKFQLNWAAYWHI